MNTKKKTNKKQIKTNKVKKFNTNNIKKEEITKPISWDELKTYHLNPPKNFLPRSKEIRIKHYIHKRKINQKYGDINKYIKNKYFTDKNKNKKFSLDKNIFPYLIEKNISHYLIWFNPKYFNSSFPDFNSKPNLISKFIKLFFPKYKLGNDIIYFENILENRSISDIRHIHIFKLQ